MVAALVLRKGEHEVLVNDLGDNRSRSFKPLIHNELSCASDVAMTNEYSVYVGVNHILCIPQ